MCVPLSFIIIIIINQVLGLKLQNVEDIFIRQSEILQAKQKLYDICYNKAIDLVSSSSVGIYLFRQKYLLYILLKYLFPVITPLDIKNDHFKCPKV